MPSGAYLLCVLLHIPYVGIIRAGHASQAHPPAPAPPCQTNSVQQTGKRKSGSRVKAKQPTLSLLSASSPAQYKIFLTSVPVLPCGIPVTKSMHSICILSKAYHSPVKFTSLFLVCPPRTPSSAPPPSPGYRPDNPPTLWETGPGIPRNRSAHPKAESRPGLPRYG